MLPTVYESECVLKEEPMSEKRRWFQFHLSTLLAMQLVAAVYVGANMLCWKEYWTHVAYGFPCKWYVPGFYFGSLSLHNTALIANVLVGITLLTAVYAVCELYHRCREKGAADTFRRYAPSLETCLFFMQVFYLYSLLIAVATFSKNGSSIWVGWPYPIYISLYQSVEISGCRGLIVDVYVGLVWIVPLALAFERWIRRREAHETNVVSTYLIRIAYAIVGVHDAAWVLIGVYAILDSISDMLLAVAIAWALAIAICGLVMAGRWLLRTPIQSKNNSVLSQP